MAKTSEAAVMNLHDHETEIDLTLRSLPRRWAPALAALVKQTFRDQRRRAINGRKNASAYSQAVEQGIRRAISTLSPRARALGEFHLTSQVREWIRRQGPAYFGLRRFPDEEVVRRVICKVLAESKSVSAETCEDVVDESDAQRIMVA
jgi:hypothetical protein